MSQLPTTLKTPRRTRLQAFSIALALVSLVSLHVTSCSKAVDDGGANACDRVKCGAACSSSADCGSGTYCNNDGKCVADCVANSDCPNAQACAGGKCTIFGVGSSGGSGGEGGGIGNGGSPGTLAASNGGFKEVDPTVISNVVAKACSGWATELETLPAKLEFVLDTSLSMTERKQGNSWVTSSGSGQSKWEICRAAVETAIDGLSPDVAVGVSFFPDRGVGGTNPSPVDVSACLNTSRAVAIDSLGAVGSTQRTALKSALDAIQADGNTPTFEAYKFAVNQMLAVNDKFSGQPYVVLVTDGVPTYGEGCVGTGREDGNVPTDPIIGLISQAAEVGVKTFVIGSPGSEKAGGNLNVDTRGWLSAAARAGKTDTPGCSDTGPTYCHMDMTQSPDFSSALRAGLGVITSQLGNCEYLIPVSTDPSKTVDVNQLSVFVTNGAGDYLIMPSTQADCTEGWQLVDGKIKLCPDSCNRAEADQSGRVQILAGCTTQEVIDNYPIQ